MCQNVWNCEKDSFSFLYSREISGCSEEPSFAIELLGLVKNEIQKDLAHQSRREFIDCL